MRLHPTLLFVVIITLAISAPSATAQQFTSDILNLNIAQPELLTAYLTPNKLRLEDAWDLLNGMPTLPLMAVTVGIIDEPLDRLHPEF